MLKFDANPGADIDFDAMCERTLKAYSHRGRTFPNAKATVRFKNSIHWAPLSTGKKIRMKLSRCQRIFVITELLLILDAKKSALYSRLFFATDLVANMFLLAELISVAVNESDAEKPPLYSRVFVVTNFVVDRILCFHKNLCTQVLFNRGFPKVDHSGVDARIVLEQINSAKKKLPLTGLELSTLGLSVLLTSCLSCLTPVLDSC